MRGYTCGSTREGCANYFGWRVSSSSSTTTAHGRAAAGGRLSIVLAPGKKLVKRVLGTEGIGGRTSFTSRRE